MGKDGNAAEKTSPEGWGVWPPIRREAAKLRRSVERGKRKESHRRREVQWEGTGTTPARPIREHVVWN